MTLPLLTIAAIVAATLLFGLSRLPALRTVSAQADPAQTRFSWIFGAICLALGAAFAVGVVIYGPIGSPWTYVALAGGHCAAMIGLLLWAEARLRQLAAGNA